MKLEDIVRQAIRQQLCEAEQRVVSLEMGNSLQSQMRDAMVARNAEKLKVATKEAIKTFKVGDRADQKLAGNLRAFQGSLKAGRGDWNIVELAFAEWKNRRKALTPNPVVESNVNERTNTSRKQISDDDIKKVVSFVKDGTPKERIINSIFGRKLDLTMGDIASFMDMDEKGLLESRGSRRRENDPLYVGDVPRGRCPKCDKNVQLDAGGLIHHHNVPGDKFNTCPGSKNEPINESKKTELETIYESIESFARRSHRDVFEVLDNMMFYCELTKDEGPTSELPDMPVVPSEPVPPSMKVDSDPAVANGGPPGFRPPPPVGFDHQGTWVEDPLTGADAAGVAPNELYGDAFMNSKFPFEFNGTWIVDPRYDETGELEIPDAEKHYGDAYRGSDYFRLKGTKK